MTIYDIGIVFYPDDPVRRLEQVYEKTDFTERRQATARVKELKNRLPFEWCIFVTLNRDYIHLLNKPSHQIEANVSSSLIAPQQYPALGEVEEEFQPFEQESDSDDDVYWTPEQCARIEAHDGEDYGTSEDIYGF